MRGWTLQCEAKTSVQGNHLSGSDLKMRQPHHHHLEANPLAVWQWTPRSLGQHPREPSRPLTCARSLVWHQCVAFAAAAFVAALRVGAVRVAAAVGYGALIDVWGRRERSGSCPGRRLGYALRCSASDRDKVGEVLKGKESSPSQKKAPLAFSANRLVVGWQG